MRAFLRLSVVSRSMLHSRVFNLSMFGPFLIYAWQAAGVWFSPLVHHADNDIGYVSKDIPRSVTHIRSVPDVPTAVINIRSVPDISTAVINIR
jgi:hypothetical protein